MRSFRTYARGATRRFRKNTGALACALALASSVSQRNAYASEPGQPKGWVSVRTLGFRMALPGDYREFYTFKKDRRQPHLGNWGFTSPNATRKIFVRVSTLKEGTPKRLLQKSEHHLRRKVGGLRKLSEHALPADPSGRDGVIAFYSGAVHARSRSTGQMGEYAHVVIRCILREPRHGTQLTVTHMVRSDRADDADTFFTEHLGTFVLRSPAEARKLAASVRRPSAPRKTTRPAE